MDTVLEVKDLCKSFPDFSLQSVNFQLERGTITGFIGPNGSGKTTTIKCILNLLHPESGNITALGLDSQKQERELKDQLGIVMDEGYYFENLTLREMKNLLRPVYSAWDDRAYQSYTRRFNLPENKKIKDPSRGMRMKYSIALSMSHHAKLFIMDEPTSGLDPVTRSEFTSILKEIIADGEHTVLFSTHITSDLDKIADMLILLYNGEILLKGEKDEIKDRHIIVKGANSKWNAATEPYFISCHKTPYGFEGLASDRKAVKRFYQDEVTYEVPNVEDLMLYYTGRGQQ